MNPNLPEPPAHLSAESAGLWRWCVAEYELHEGHLVILRGALESLDRAEEARVLVDRQGVTVLDRYEVAKVNPAVVVQRDALAAAHRALRQLDLEGEPDPLNSQRGRQLS
jgi:hypothetical protein